MNKTKIAVLVAGIILTSGASAIVARYFALLPPTVEVQTLTANADSAVATFERQGSALLSKTPKSKEDSTALSNSQINLIYWRGVRDAFRSLDEKSVKVKK